MRGNRDKATSSTSQRWRVLAWSMVGVLLVLPAIAMRFTDEVNWRLGDFIFAAVLLVGTGLAIEASLRFSASTSYRSGVAVTVVTALLLVWINGAVGIIGNEDNPANLLYAGVLAAAAVGALLAKFRAPGMARAMLAAAVVQSAIMVAAPLAGWGPPGDPAFRTFFLNGVFVALWLVAWRLFRNVTTVNASPA